MSLMRGVICGLGCRNNCDKAECSKNGMFVDPHTQNSNRLPEKHWTEGIVQ